MKTNKIYLPGLNGIRAIAAVAVIVSHIGLSLSNYKFNNASAYSLASFGVTMFFALSGFLITYLCLIEKNTHRTIDIRKFYIRRIFRIWPLYYFYIIIVLAIVGFTFSNKIFYYLLLVPNIPFAQAALIPGMKAFPYLSHYWSVGVEEQFYAFWPWLLNRSNRILTVTLGFFFAFLLFKLSLSVFNGNKLLLTILYYTRFGCLALGGAFAYLVIVNHKVIQFIKHPVCEILSWSIVLLAAIGKYHVFSIIDHEIFAVATLVIIVNQITNTSKIISLENKVFDYFGKISYGLYIYNPLVIYLVSLVLKKFVTQDVFLSHLIIYVVNLLVIVFISHVSYQYFEKPILKLKERFSMISSVASKEELDEKN